MRPSILTQALTVFRTRTIEGLEADADRCRELLDRSTAVATALSPYLGYAATAEIAKAAVATNRSIRDLVLERGLMPAERLDARAVAGGDDRAGRAGGGVDDGSAVRPCWRGLVLAVVAGLPLGAQDRPRRLFPPEELGVLEGPDRDAWQKPELVMDALAIGERSRGGRRRGRRRLVHGAAGAARGPQRPGLRPGRAAADARLDQPARRPRGLLERASTSAASGGTRSCPKRRSTRC